MTERERPDGAGMTEHSPFTAARHIPQFDRVVMAPRRNRLAIRRVRERADHVGVTRERGELFAGGPVPKLDRSVVAAGGEHRAIWRERHGLNRAAVSR